MSLIQQSDFVRVYDIDIAPSMRRLNTRDIFSSNVSHFNKGLWQNNEVYYSHRSVNDPNIRNSQYIQVDVMIDNTLRQILNKDLPMSKWVKNLNIALLPSAILYGKLQRYQTGGKFSPHYDRGFGYTLLFAPPDQKFEGGDLVIYDEKNENGAPLQEKARFSLSGLSKWRLIVFPKNVKHACEPVVSGIRYVLTVDAKLSYDFNDFVNTVESDMGRPTSESLTWTSYRQSLVDCLDETGHVYKPVSTGTKPVVAGTKPVETGTTTDFELKHFDECQNMYCLEGQTCDDCLRRSKQLVNLDDDAEICTSDNMCDTCIRIRALDTSARIPKSYGVAHLENTITTERIQNFLDSGRNICCIILKRPYYNNDPNILFGEDRTLWDECVKTFGQDNVFLRVGKFTMDFANSCGGYDRDDIHDYSPDHAVFNMERDGYLTTVSTTSILNSGLLTNICEEFNDQGAYSIRVDRLITYILVYGLRATKGCQRSSE